MIEETAYHIISYCNKLTQKELNSMHDWVGKVINWQLCKILKFDKTDKWYTHQAESVKENKTDKILLDLEIQIDHQKSARRPNLVLINHFHHHVVRLARISLTLSPHFSLSFIASGRSSGLHPVSSHSCCMYVHAGRPAIDWPYAGVHRSTSLTISSLLLQQCPACLVSLACIVFVIGGRWPYIG